MKRKTFLLLICLTLLLPLLFVSICAVGLPAKYDATYMGELKYKYGRLASVRGPKIVLIGLGILNALAFQWLWRASTVNTQAELPRAAKLQAAVSLAIWISAAALGRLLAYV